MWVYAYELYTFTVTVILIKGCVYTINTFCFHRARFTLFNTPYVVVKQLL